VGEVSNGFTVASYTYMVTFILHVHYDRRILGLGFLVHRGLSCSICTILLWRRLHIYYI
jgi:hypothetical protein